MSRSEAYESEAAKGGAEVEAVHVKRAPFDCQLFGAPSLAGDANKPGPADRAASGMHCRPQCTILLHFVCDSNDLTTFFAARPMFARVMF